ncbi:MAG: protein kinase family protein [Flavobacteriaceae bacterium]|nr:protein kinase family protein [Flavobacteriaceae bacterium]
MNNQPKYYQNVIIRGNSHPLQQVKILKQASRDRQIKQTPDLLSEYFNNKCTTLGKGSFGTVKKCTIQDNHLAIKNVKFNEKSTTHLFDREAQFMIRIKNYYTTKGDNELKNSIINYHGCARDEIYQGYFLIELLKNDLTLLKNEKGDSGASIFKKTIPNKLDRINEYIKLFQTLNTIHYEPELKIVLNDIKPDNIMMNDQGNLKFIDLGMCEDIGEFLKGGTILYYPPEKINSFNGNYPSFDTWALALTLLEVETELYMNNTD